MSGSTQITRAAVLSSLAEFRGLIDAACADHPQVDPQAQYELKLAVEEACTNIITHGYEGMNPGSVTLTLEFEPGCVRVTLTDFGHPFEPYEPPAPDVQGQLEGGPGGGFGLFLIYQTMDQIDYRTAIDGNHLTFVKRLGAHEETSRRGYHGDSG